MPDEHSVQLNKIETIKLQQPFDEVWHACLSLAVQGAGIIRLQNVSNTHKRFIFVAQEPRPFVPAYLSYLERVKGSVDQTFLETMLLVEVQAIDTGSTVVHIAWISPETGQLESTDISGRELTTEEGKQINVAVNAQIEYINAVQTYLEASDRWRKLLDIPLPQKRNTKSSLEIERQRSDWEGDAEEFGNFESYEMEGRSYLITNDKVVRKIRGIAVHIAKANGYDAREIRVSLVSSTEPNSFSMSNGNIYIYTGMLDDLDDQAQLAGVLGHEIDHVFQRDNLERLKEDYKWRNIKFNVFSLSLFTALTVVVAQNPEAYFSNGNDTSYTYARFVGLFETYGTGFLALIAGTEITEAYFPKVSIAQELRADRNATIYLYNAGYRPDAWLSYLEKRAGLTHGHAI